MLDWKSLAPHRPLDGDDPRYVTRTDGEDRLARSLEKTRSPILIAGAAGVGKSTEIARAASWLQHRSDTSVLLVRIDRFYNMRTVGEAQLLEAILHELYKLRAKPPRPGVASLQVLAPPDVGDDLERASDILQGEVRRFRKEINAHLIVIVDGLEKCSEKLAGQLVRTLLNLRKLFMVAAVVPPGLVVGPGNQDLIQLYDARIYPIRAVYIQSAVASSDWQSALAEPGYRFFFNLAERRLGALAETPPGFQYQVLRAAVTSGGVPRVFLRLLELAHSSAQVAEREWPDYSDFDDAIREEESSVELALRDGDLAELRAIHRGAKTDLEIPIERRLRFLSHGLILEYATADRRRLVLVTPLLFRLVTQG